MSLWLSKEEHLGYINFYRVYMEIVRLSDVAVVSPDLAKYICFGDQSHFGALTTFYSNISFHSD